MLSLLRVDGLIPFVPGIPALMTRVFSLQAIMAAAKPEDALDVGLSASGFRKTDHEVLDSYIAAQETQQSGPSSASACESGSESSSEEDSGQTSQHGTLQQCAIATGATPVDDKHWLACSAGGSDPVIDAG